MKEVKAYQKKVEKAADDLVRRLTEQGVSLAQLNASYMDIYDTGELMRGIESQYKGKIGFVVSTAAHSIFCATGKGGHALIDIESFLFSQIAGALRSTYEGIFVSGEYVDSPARFPAVTIVESDNSVLPKMRTAAPNLENAVSMMYEVNVYTNSVGYKKSEAKDIMETIDNEFSKIGFTRTMCNPVSNLQDATIYRIVARYEGVADKNFRIYTK